jgi:hypothetical protein
LLRQARIVASDGAAHVSNPLVGFATGAGVGAGVGLMISIGQCDGTPFQLV